MQCLEKGEKPMTIVIFCIAFITVVALIFIWAEEESTRISREAEAQLLGLLADYSSLFVENLKVRAELAKYKRPRGKNGRFV
jgi:hypothetical protein